MNDNNNNNNNNNNKNHSFNENKFILQMEKNLNWDECDLSIAKEKTKNSSSNILPNFNQSRSSSNNIRIDNQKQSPNPFSVPNKISLLDMKHFNFNLSEELLIQYENNEALANQVDPNVDDEIYSVNYSLPSDNSYCEDCSIGDNNNNDNNTIMHVPQFDLSYDEIETDPFLLNRSDGQRRKFSPIPFKKAEFKSKSKTKDIIQPAEDIPIFNKGDDLMKYDAFNIPFGAIARCNQRQCPYGGHCVGQRNMDEIMALKEGFWGKQNESAPSTSERRLKIEAILRESYRNRSHDFEFCITNREKNNVIVCEAGFLILLGLSNKSNPSEAPSQWRRVKKFIQKYRGQKEPKYSYNELVLKGDPKREEKEACKVKFEKCVAFITYFVKHNGESVPDATGAMGADINAKELRVAPFCDVTSFHEEYQIHCSENYVVPEEVACESEFRLAFAHLHKTEGIRLQSAKGGFNTCEVCHNCKELSRNKQKIHKPSMREVVRQFKHLHLGQQSKERRKLDVRKLEALETDEFGQPIRALLFADFMTYYTCRTPFSKTTVKGDQFIETRLCGIEVYCGPIKTVFIYRVDALVSGGANLMVEIVRQALIDLLELLRNKGLRAPRNLGLQFDNCGENKNKEMFGYVSVLIEDFIFDLIEICFLIVGHTHASIDQYFSRIAKAIYSKKTRFIGSPLGLLHLVKCCHKRTYQQDPIIRDIIVHYDFAEAIKPYIKSSIKYYSIPHYFILKAIHPRIATMQHMMFSFNETLLPIPTDKSISCRDELLDSLVDAINVSKDFSIVNGKFAVKEKFGFTSSGKVKRKQIDNSVNINKEKVSSILNSQVQSESQPEKEDDDSSVASLLFGNKKKSEDLTTLNELLPSLEALSMQSIFQQDQRMDDEAKGKRPKIATKYQIPYIGEIRKTLNKTSNADKGYIVWLSTKKAISEKTDSNNWRDLIKPKPFDYKEILFHLDVLIKEDTEKKQHMSNELLDLPHYDCVDNLKSVRTQKRSESNNYGGEEVMSSDPFSVRNRRVYKTATEIATSAQWVLNQIELGIIGKDLNRQDFYDDLTSNFLKSTLNAKEIDWYESRNTAEKVLRLVQEEYDNAPEWEPLPINKLSLEDLTKIQELELKYKANVEIAQKLGNDALVKLGHNFKDGEQVVSYVRNEAAESIQRISKALKDVRTKGKTSKGTIMKKPTEVKFYLCDIDSCDHIVCTADNIKCLNEFCMNNCFRKGLRYCSEHLEHEKHLAIKKRFKRQLADKVKLSINPNCNNDIQKTNSKKERQQRNESTISNNNSNNNKRKVIDITISQDELIKSNNDLKNNNKEKSGLSETSSSTLKNNSSMTTTTTTYDNKKSKQSVNFSEIDNRSNTKCSTIADDRVAKRKRGSTITLAQNLESGEESQQDKLIKSCLYKLTDEQIYQLFDGLPSNHLFKSNNSIFKLFLKIRNTVTSNNFQPINLVELIKFPIYFNDLKILAIDVFKIDIAITKLLNTDTWKEISLTKNKYLKDQFINKFVECFLHRYQKNN